MANHEKPREKDRSNSSQRGKSGSDKNSSSRSGRPGSQSNEGGDEKGRPGPGIAPADPDERPAGER